MRYLLNGCSTGAVRGRRQRTGRTREEATSLDLRGSNVLLTGGSSGIGRALAKRLADRGARLAIAARREDLLEGLTDEVERAGGARPAALPTDLSRAGQAAHLPGRPPAEPRAVDRPAHNARSSGPGLP